MRLLSHKVQKSELKRGDHVYTYRIGITLSHHGIYLGEDKVVHYRSDAPPSISARSPSSEFNKNNSNVAITSLDKFLGNGSLHRVEYGVPRLYFFVKLRGGTFTFAPSDPPDEVIYRAIYLYNTGFGNYDLCENNCEDFALYCKTGLQLKWKTGIGMSGQISQYGRLLKWGSFGASIFGAGCFVTFSFPGLCKAISLWGSLGPFTFTEGAINALSLAGSMGTFSYMYPIVLGLSVTAIIISIVCSYYEDLGNRGDVVKVEVENLAAFRTRRDEAVARQIEVVPASCHCRDDGGTTECCIPNDGATTESCIPDDGDQLNSLAQMTDPLE